MGGLIQLIFIGEENEVDEGDTICQMEGVFRTSSRKS
jgi:hypothetical protein